MKDGRGPKKYFFSSLLLLRGGGGGRRRFERTIRLFYKSCFFVGMFQYDFGAPKHALELRDYIN